MPNIFTRKALNDIMANEGLTPEQRTEQIFGLYGRALDDGYIAKGAAAQAQETALANAKAADLTLSPDVVAALGDATEEVKAFLGNDVDAWSFDRIK